MKFSTQLYPPHEKQIGNLLKHKFDNDSVNMHIVYYNAPNVLL